MALAPAREAFMPPPTPGLGRAVLMALVAHTLLVLALSFAVQWRQSAPEPVTFSAELWAAVPSEAAPPAAQALPEQSVIEPPAPKPAPTPAPEPQPAPKPTPPAAPTQAPPKPADIALEKKKALQEAKKKQDLAQAKAQAELQLEKDKAEQQKKRKAEAEKLQADKVAKLKEEKVKDDKLKAEKRLKAEKSAEAARKKEAQQAAEEAAQSEQRRKEAKDRALRLAGTAVGNGEADAKGAATQSAGPSASYGGKIVAAIRPNITQLKEISGNPSVEYDVYTDPSGNVLSAKLRKKSGDPYWDETAYNAILKTAKLPRDDTGRVPSPMTIALEPKPK